MARFTHVKNDAGSDVTLLHNRQIFPPLYRYRQSVLLLEGFYGFCASGARHAQTAAREQEKKYFGPFFALALVKAVRQAW
jgi:hypothetical protein